VLLRPNNQWMNRPTVDQGGSVTLVHVAAFDWPSLPSSLLSVSGRHSHDRRGGVNWTSQSDWLRGSAVVQGHTPVHPWAIWFKWHRWWAVRYCHGAGWTQRPRPFSRRLPDGSLRSRTLVMSSTLADILTSWVLIWGCVLYIGLQIFTLWQKSKAGVRIIFDGVLYSKFHGILASVFDHHNANF